MSDLGKCMIYKPNPRRLEDGCIHCGLSLTTCEARRELRDAEHCCWRCEVADRDPH